MSQIISKAYHAYIDFAVSHPLYVAVVLALAAPYVLSALPTGVRHIKNMVSALSARRLQNRIIDLERYKESVNTDKALYLSILRIILLVLALMCISVMLLILQQLGFLFRGNVAALSIFAIALILGIQGLIVGSLDSRAKVSDLISKLDREIAGLRAKLAARMQDSTKK
jgi:hypothetical protein